MNAERRNRRKLDRLQPIFLPLALCLMLVACVLSIGAIRQGDRIEKNAKQLAKAEDVQKEVAKGAKRAIRRACKVNNELRTELRNIVKNGLLTLKQYRAEGLLTQAQYDRAVVEQKRTIRKLKNTRCNNAAKVVPLPSQAATPTRKGTQ